MCAVGKGSWGSYGLLLVPRSAALAAFEYPSFRWFQIARFVSVVAIQIQGVAIGWQVYSLTQDPLDLGFVGLAQFAPALLLSLFAGQVADRVDRRTVAMVCQGILALCALAMAWEGSGPSPWLPAMYGLLVLVGVARAFLGPASAALMPNLIPTEIFPSAVAWNSSTWQVATIVGPSLGGIAYGLTNSASAVYAGCAVLFLITTAMFLGVRAQNAQQTREPASLQHLLAGLVYVWRQKIVLGAISLDLFAVLLGGAVALLPIYASDILRVGPWGLGVLRSAPGLGAAMTALALAWFPIRRRAGLLLFSCVGLFGLATVVFGISSNFALSVAALVVIGASDMISVYVRQTVVQLTTPDAMRGRVSAVNLVFIGASNELGEMESGLAAHWLGAVNAVVLGGVGTVLVVLSWTQLFPSLWHKDRLVAEPSQPSPETSPAAPTT